MSDKSKNGSRRHARPPHQMGAARSGRQRREQVRVARDYFMDVRSGMMRRS